MSETTGLKFTGLEEAKAALVALGNTVEKKIVRKGLRAGAKVILAEARADAPEKSGRTRRNIKIRGGKSRKGVIALSVAASAKDFQGDAFYVAFVLFGHFTGKRLRGNFKGASGKERYHEASVAAGRKFIPGNNFLGRAAASQKQTAVDAAIASWAEQIEQAGTNKGQG